MLLATCGSRTAWNSGNSWQTPDERKQARTERQGRVRSSGVEVEERQNYDAATESLLKL